MKQSQEEFDRVILETMKNDDVFKVIESSKAIQSLGTFIFEKHGPKKPEETKQAMRMIARLLLEARTVWKKGNMSVEKLL